jgi:hypothetical protein
MGKIWLVVLLGIFGWACSSDCVSCHPGLDIKNDERHTPLAQCVVCHPPESLESSASMSGCGTDCFKCHDANKLKITAEHTAIAQCIGCHEGMVSAQFLAPPDALPKGFLLNDVLKKSN